MPSIIPAHHYIGWPATCNICHTIAGINSDAPGLGRGEFEVHDDADTGKSTIICATCASNAQEEGATA